MDGYQVLSGCGPSPVIRPGQVQDREHMCYLLALATERPAVLNNVAALVKVTDVGCLQYYIYLYGLSVVSAASTSKLFLVVVYVYLSFVPMCQMYINCLVNTIVDNLVTINPLSFTM